MIRSIVTGALVASLLAVVAPSAKAQPQNVVTVDAHAITPANGSTYVGSRNDGPYYYVYIATINSESKHTLKLEQAQPNSNITLSCTLTQSTAQEQRNTSTGSFTTQATQSSGTQTRTTDVNGTWVELDNSSLTATFTLMATYNYVFKAITVYSMTVPAGGGQTETLASSVEDTTNFSVTSP